MNDPELIPEETLSISDADQVPEESWEGMADYDQTEPDYDFEDDRVCSFPCEICGESWEDEEDFGDED